MFKVLHISKNNDLAGAGAAARNLHEALQLAGVFSCLLPLDKKTGDLTPVLAEALRQVDLAQYDLIHLHGLGTAVSPLLLPFLSARPLVWSLEDCSSYTGGCQHSAHCGQWQADCQDCPLYINDAAGKEKQAEALALKKQLYKALNCQLLVSNAWQLEQLSRSILQGKPAAVLPPIGNPDNFHLGNRRIARQNLGLPENSLVLAFHSDIGEHEEEILAMVEGVVRDIRQGVCHISLINIGRRELPAAMADIVRNIDPQKSSLLLGEYYRAASLNLYFAGLDACYHPVCEAGQCALPSIVFDLGAARELLAGECGFVIPPFDSQALAACLRQALLNPMDSLGAGLRFYQKLQSAGVAEYLKLYEKATGRNLSAYTRTFAGEAERDLERIMDCGWQSVQAFLNEKRKASGIDAEEDDREKQQKTMQQNIYVDGFCKKWLTFVRRDADPKAIWQFVQIWMKQRNVDVQMRFISQAEAKAFYDVAIALRDVLVEYFRRTSLAQFQGLSPEANEKIIQLWRALFLNLNSVLHLNVPAFVCPPELLKDQPKTGYPVVFLQSMFTPYLLEDPKVNVRATLASDLPFALRAVILLWVTNMPLYSGTEFHRECIGSYIKTLAEEILQQPAALPPSLKMVFFEHFVLGLWRLSYLGGNNIELLRAYGDLLQAQVKEVYPEFSQPLKLQKRKKGKKLRIGYVSMNFRGQAVSQYMANRIKYHDAGAFFVKTFVLSKHSDAMTDAIKGWSDEWQEFTDLQDFGAIAAAIKSSDLDLLIYADIGMNILTYLLGAMKLAPVQAVLVGHGTTTGLSSIDYYVSGDHEPQAAQQHYTERIVRLPRLGSAQLPPPQTENKMTRAEIGVPEQAVMFISCANGIKHFYQRDELLVDILRQAPEAYIVLKPFQGPDTVDFKFKQRVMEKAKAAGVEQRLIILPPLARPGDLMGLLVLADIQLDTYPYGGWTTNLEALYYHLPIVTQEGDQARSRWGAGLLLAMDIKEGIARTEREYVKWAVKLAQDTQLRLAVKKKIAACVENTLFNGPGMQPAYEQALLQMIEQKEGRKIK